MKKLLLALTAMVGLGIGAEAQTRFSLYEEFTGENCGPCASTNPTFWALCVAGTNTDKMLQISYMVNIPSAGPFYNQNAAQTDARRSYYSVTSAPNGRFDGALIGTGHPGSFTQANIDARYAVASPFNVTVTNTWSADYDSVYATVSVTCVASAGYSASSIKLRSALVQTVDWASPPGSNGETHFKDVVRRMYPDANGTTVPATWTMGMTQTYTISGPVPNHVQKEKSPYMVVWIQNEADKSIAQAAKATPLPALPNDGAIIGMTVPAMQCQPNGTLSAAHSVILKNTGTNTATSATIYYKVDNGTYTSYAWSGSLAVNATTSVSIPAASVTISGSLYHSFIDSVGTVNGAPDQNTGNNVWGRSFFVQSTTAVALPYTTSYESADGGKFYFSDNNSNGAAWGTYYSTSGSLSHTGANALMFYAYAFPNGETETAGLPIVTITNPSAMDFWVAYAQRTSTSADKLEVVYSSDCGSTWTSIWSKEGAALATDAISSSLYIPTSTDYRKESANISTVPAGSWLAFRATGNAGNCIWIDDVNLRTGTVSVNDITAATLNMNVYPNPATQDANLSFSLADASEVMVTVVDQVGRVVNTVANQKMNAGIQRLVINTNNMATGLYTVVVRTEAGAFTQQLSVIK